MNDDDTALLIAHTSSGAEELARKIPQARFVSAFNTCRAKCCSACMPPSARRVGRDSAEPGVLRRRRESEEGRRAADPRRSVSIRWIGPSPHRPLTEPFALLVAQLAYEGKGGPELAYRSSGLTNTAHASGTAR